MTDNDGEGCLGIILAFVVISLTAYGMGFGAGKDDGIKITQDKAAAQGAGIYKVNPNNGESYFEFISSKPKQEQKQESKVEQ